MTERTLQCRFAPVEKGISCPDDALFLNMCVSSSAVYVQPVSPDQADALGREGYVTQIEETSRVDWLDGVHVSSQSVEGKWLMCKRVQLALAESIVQIAGVRLDKGNR